MYSCLNTICHLSSFLTSSSADIFTEIDEDRFCVVATFVVFFSVKAHNLVFRFDEFI